MSPLSLKVKKRIKKSTRKAVREESQSGEVRWTPPLKAIDRNFPLEFSVHTGYVAHIISGGGYSWPPEVVVHKRLYTQ